MNGTGGFINPEQILEQIAFRDNLSAADFGCGHGYFTIPLAKMLKQGTVYACDVIEEALEAVRSKAELEKLSNIKTIRCNLEELGATKINTSSMDIVVLANILYQSQKKASIVREAVRVLKEEGELAIIDWINGASLAPKSGWLILEEESKKIVKDEGLILNREIEINDSQHFGLIFRKSELAELGQP